MLHRVIVLFLAACAILLAQGVTGTILGTVTDPTGAPVIGATVRATNTLTGESRTAETNQTGEYLFPVLPTGQCRIEAEMHGFKC